MTEPKSAESTVIAATSARPAPAAIPEKSLQEKFSSIPGVRDTDEVVSLEAHAKNLADWKECDDQIVFWSRRRDAIQAEIGEALGDATVGVIGNRIVVTRRRTEAFQGKEFAKKYPDLAKLYTREMSVEKLDVAWLKQAQPALWAEFQSRPWKNTFEA